MFIFLSGAVVGIVGTLLTMSLVMRWTIRALPLDKHAEATAVPTTQAVIEADG